MHVVSVHARAFGPLRDRWLTLAPGMNVVFGPNEAGKSSWHAAIYVGLCGMRRSRGAQVKEDRDFTERHRPWDGAEWAVTVTLETADGRRLEIQQDLADLAACRVTDLGTGQDLTSQLLNEGTPDTARLLGLTRRTLPPTISVRQAEILRVLDSPTDLQEHLQRAAATAGADQTAEAAIERIKRFHAERVGSPRAWTKPLQVAAERLTSEQATLDQARRKHEEYLVLVEQREAAGREAGSLERQLAAARLELDRRRVDGLRSRVNRARGLATRLPEEPSGDSDKSRVLRDQVVEALAALEGSPQEPGPLEGLTAAEIERELEALPEPPAGDLERAAEVLEAEDAWNDARHRRMAHDATRPQPPPPMETGGLLAGELRGLAATLEQVLPAVDPDLERRLAELGGRGRSAGRPGLWAVVGVLLATGGGVLLAVDLAVVGVLVLGTGALLLVFGLLLPLLHAKGPAGTAVLEARLATQRDRLEQVKTALDAARRRLRQAGLPEDADELRERAETLENAATAARALERWRQQHAALEVEDAGAARALRERLSARPGGPGAASGAALDELLKLYRIDCRKRKARADEAARRPTLEQALAARRSAERTVETARTQRQQVELKVWEVASACGVEAGELELAVARLRARREELDDQISRLELQGRDRAALEQILEGRALHDLEEELERAEKQLPHGASPQSSGESEAEIETRVQEVEARYEAARQQQDRLAGRVSEYERSLPDVAAAEEAVDQASAEQSRLEKLNAILNRTQEFLEAARDRVQRDIAPRLKAAIEAHLCQVTGGRYDEAIVSAADLGVQIRLRGSVWRNATLCSHGTAEQVYLLLRLAMADHLVKRGESAPLFLDDVTTQSDTARTAAILELLHESSRQRQIVFFSQEDEVLAWARERLQEPRDRLTELGRSDSEGDRAGSRPEPSPSHRYDPRP